MFDHFSRPAETDPYAHMSYSNVRLSFVHLRWAQSYVSLVIIYYLFGGVGQNLLYGTWVCDDDFGAFTWELQL